jgi:hypothetical protein
MLKKIILQDNLVLSNCSVNNTFLNTYFAQNRVLSTGMGEHGGTNKAEIGYTSRCLWSDVRLKYTPIPSRWCHYVF